MLDSLLEPGATSGEAYLSDRSEQGCFVLEGELTVWLDQGDAVTLQANDCFQLQPHAPFRYANLTDRTTRVLWVFN
jgi:mannose-6-phosphate isomerase-like protein (cupin superfamily)